MKLVNSEIVIREYLLREYLYFDMDIKPYISNGDEYRRDEIIDRNGNSLDVNWFSKYPNGEFHTLSKGDVGNLELDKRYKEINRNNNIDKVIENE